PEDVELALALAASAKAAGDETSQHAAAARAVAAGPDDARTWLALWNAYAPKQRFGELADEVTALAAKSPKNVYAAHYAGMACANARRFDDALAWLEKAWTIQGNDNAARTEAARILRDE